MNRFLFSLLVTVIPCFTVQAQFSIQQNQITCFDTCNGSLQILPQGNLHYLWSTGDTTSSIGLLCAGIYSCTVADSTGIVLDTLYSTLAQPSPILLSSVPVYTSTCSVCDGLIRLYFSGGTAPYSYNWSDHHTGPIDSNLCQGVYGVTVNDANGCSTAGSCTILTNQGPAALTCSATMANCDSLGSLSVTPVGIPPYTYAWSTTPVQTTSTATGLPPGAYTVSVTDSTGCLHLGTAVLNYRCQDFISGTVFWDANNNCVVDTGDMVFAGVTVLAINGVHTFSGITNAIGNYFIAVDTNGTYTVSQGNSLTHILQHYDLCGNFQTCPLSDTITFITGGDTSLNNNIAFIGRASPVVTIIASMPGCDTIGTITANVTGGSPPYTYNWNSNPVQTTATATGLSPGFYLVTVTDTTGCTHYGSAILNYTCQDYITGTVFQDVNGNCIPDSGETVFAGITVIVHSQYSYYNRGITNALGQYSIPVDMPGFYTLSIAGNGSSSLLNYSNCGYFEQCPANDTVRFPLLGDTSANNNFAWISSSNGFDLSIQPSWSGIRPDHSKTYWISYANLSPVDSFTGTATIIFDYDPNLTYQSSSPLGVNDPVAHTLTWIVNQVPFISTTVGLVNGFFLASSSLTAGSVLINDFYIEPYAGDCDTSNNHVHIPETVSFDPNSKQVFPGGDISENDSVLTYTIHFQNTGTGTAVKVIVADTLSPYLDASTVHNLAASRTYSHFYVLPGGIVAWIFDSIMLVDSSVSFSGSQGFVMFSVQLKKGLTPGTDITNHASIYFDANAPVGTNITSNIIVTTAINELQTNKVSVNTFPNPFIDNTTIVVDGLKEKFDFSLYDVTGRLKKIIPSIDTNRFELQRGDLSSGIYMFKISTSTNQVAYGKLVID